LKNFGGASGFAGAGNLGSAAAGSYHGYGTDGSGVDQTGQALLGGSSTPANGAATSALGSGAIPTGPDGKVDAKTSAAKADDKKWSFGSFANSIEAHLVSVRKDLTPTVRSVHLLKRLSKEKLLRTVILLR